MSENKDNLSIDEIIARAEKIKKQADEQLVQAKQSLDEMAKAAIKSIEVDAQEVQRRVDELSQEEEDVKIAPTKEAQTSSTITFPRIKKNKTTIFSIRKPAQENDDDMKIIDDADEDIKIYGDKDENIKIAPAIKQKDEDIFEEDLIPNDKTKPILVVVNDKKSTSNEDDLEEVPTLIAKENIGKYLDQGSSEEEVGVQISFAGFDDSMDNIPTIDEAEAEKDLNDKRQEKIEKFRIFGPEKTDEKLGDERYDEADYKSEKDKASILTNLFNKKAVLQIRIAITIVIGGIMTLITVFKNNAYFPSFLSSNIAFTAVGLTLLIAIILVNINTIVHGFNFKRGINSDFPNALLTVFTLIHTIALMLFDNLWVDNGVFLGPVLAFSMLLSQMGKRQIMSRVIDNFDFIINSDSKYTVENIANAVDTEIISRGILDEEEPIIKTSVKTDFPTNFMEISCKTEPTDSLVKILSPISVIMSIVIMIVIGIIDNFATGINMAMCALAMSTPMAILFLMNSFLSDMSEQLDKYGCRVCGYEGATMVNSTNAIVMEAADLFGKNSCDLHGIKMFNDNKVDDAIVYAAAVIVQTKSPLAHVFDDVIIGKQSILPKVENITYEEKMGTSAWIYQRKVLVGNRNLLINHGVKVPKESFERKYTVRGRKALYLAINGKIVAMFVVSYSVDPDIKRELKRLEKSDLTVIVKSNDPYINEESLAILFGLPKGYIRVMNAPGAKVYDKYSNMSVEKSPAYMVHNGGAKGFIAGMRGADVMVSTKKLIRFLVAFGCALGLAVTGLLSILKGYSQLSCATIIAYQTIWNLFILLLTKTKRWLF